VTATYDVAIVGLGAAGSATLHALARRGARVIGFDRFHSPHPLGSTHGRSRIIREAYYESPVYVPLVRRAYEAWARIARDSGQSLFRQTGGLMLGPPNGELVAGAKRSAETHGLPHDVLDASEIGRRFPGFAVEPGTVGVLEPRAGFLDPELCVQSCLELAARGGATIRFDTPVSGWRATGDTLRIDTAEGAIACDRAILASGPWLPAMLGGRLPLSVERQVTYWFRPAREVDLFRADRCPVFMWEWSPGRLFYGIPDHGYGVKVARHHEGKTVSPDEVDRTVHPEEVAVMRELVRRFLPAADGPLREAVVCLYTNTPDHHFLLGPHPEEPRVLLASACSGHGFKFASAVGEVLADLVLSGRTDVDVSLFGPGRLERREM
jgi:sarcosine oxidase